MPTIQWNAETIGIAAVVALLLAALEKLALLDVGDRDKAAVGSAVERFLPRWLARVYRPVR
jgi:hypothetical protein